MSERHFVATGYVVARDKTLLLLHKKLGFWLAPGGHLKRGELPDEAVLREIREETGLKARIVSGEPLSKAREKGVRFLPAPHRVQLEILPGHGEHIDLIYFCKVVGGREKMSLKESLSMRWCGPRELQDPALRDEVRRTALAAIRHVRRFGSTAHAPFFKLGDA